MMNYPEYEKAKEYRDRLLVLLESGRRILPRTGFESFSESILGKVRQLESDMVAFEKSSGSICAWFGIRMFNVSAQIAKSSESNIRWNSPIEQTCSLPVTASASQRCLPLDEENAPPLVPQPA
jgi:hypothetical protein